jgi:branched-chain amino acid transport system ATP-binding protein
VLENLMLGAFRKAARRDIDRNLTLAFDTFPALKGLQSQLAGTMSGGQQQMLAIARALMSGPRLLLLDEPSTGLAPIVVQSIFRTLAALHREGTMVLLVEQNVHVALEVASRAYVLEHGSVVAEGSAAALRAHDRVMAAYLGGPRRRRPPRREHDDDA